jgi:hypothetical protein
MRSVWQVEAFMRKGPTQLADLCELLAVWRRVFPLDKEQNMLGMREVLVQLSSELPFAREVQHLE